MAPRYLTLSELDRWLATETLRARHPRTATRVRPYVSDPAGHLAPLALAVRRYLALGIA